MHLIMLRHKMEVMVMISMGSREVLELFGKAQAAAVLVITAVAVAPVVVAQTVVVAVVQLKQLLDLTHLAS